MRQPARSLTSRSAATAPSAVAAPANASRAATEAAPPVSDTAPDLPFRPSRSTRRLDRLAWLTLLCLAAATGLGDIAEVSPLATLVLNAVHALLPLAIVLALCSAARNRRWPRFPSAIALPSAVWLTLLVVSAFGAAEFQAEALAALARPASGLLLAWAVCDVCRTQTRWRSLIQALALGGLAIASIAVVEATRIHPFATWIAAVHDGEIPIGDVPRVAATLSHPNEAAMYLELCLPLLIAGAWTAASRWRVPLALGSLGALLAIAVTFSRAGIVAAIAALCVLGWVGSRRGTRPQLLTLGVVVLALPLAFGWASVMDPGLDHRLLAGLDESSVDQPSRTVFWATALAIARDHPWLGAGLDNFRWLFPAYSGFSANNLGIHAHDQYLETLADTGILGLASFGWFVTLLVLTAAKGVRYARSEWPRRAALLASLTAWLVHAVLDDFDRFWPTSVAFWLIVGLVLCRPSVDRHADQRLNSQ